MDDALRFEPTHDGTALQGANTELTSSNLSFLYNGLGVRPM